MVALFVFVYKITIDTLEIFTFWPKTSLKVLYGRADPVHVHVGSNKSGDSEKFTGYNS